MVFSVGSRGSPEWVKSWINVYLTWAQSCEGLQGKWSMGNWQNRYPFRLGSREIPKLFMGVQAWVFMNYWSVCAKTSNGSFLHLDVYSPKLNNHRDFPQDRLIHHPPVLYLINILVFWIVVEEVREPHLISSLMYASLCAFLFFFPLKTIAWILVPRQNGSLQVVAE